MPPDKFSAIWVSHTSISDFLRCPRAYYLNNVYRDPQTNHKIQLMSPALALGQVVHEVLESLSVLPAEKRFKTSLTERLEKLWKKVAGEKGGFFDKKTEQLFQERGRAMLRRVTNNPGPLAKLAVKIQQDLPWYWLSEDEELILCGKIDWLEYLPNEDAVNIIDFKTGKKRDDSDSLQLPIYHLLVKNVQQRKVAKASYWYLEADDQPVEKKLPDLEQAHKQVMQVAKKIRLARKLDHYKCPLGEGGCPACQPLERVIKGEALKVGTSEFNQDIYVFKTDEQAQEALIL